MGLGEVGEGGRGVYMGGLRLGPFSVPLLHSFPPNNLPQAFGASCFFMLSMYRFYFKNDWKDFFIGVHRKPNRG